ncbi:MAG: hypothetical protein GEU99_14030 [Luteitalea sp.]|nr:hypothetical protein [Luteitalea sp.]
MTDMKQAGGLQTIFAIFLGLMVTAFLGVGVYTFYPSPEQEFDRQIRDLSRREEALRNAKAQDAWTETDRAQMQQIADERNDALDAARAVREVWGRNTSIILIIFATVAMAISLVRADQLPVISNGLLLGGVFTMVYGVGWIIATNTSIVRFIVMTAALVITLGLGYARFVRGRSVAVTPSGDAMASGQGLAGLERRVQDLEKRMDEAASALGYKRDRS